jgi:glyoxylase-like metal-dependent hydrolase (beta-lactamase superfamily II)
MGALAGYDVACIRAANAGPLTLSGTNTWVAGRDPCTVVDPGPDLDAHLDAVAAEVERRGGRARIRLTHDHADHAEGVEALLRRLPDGELVANEPGTDAEWSTVHLPGHSPDHHVFVFRERVCFTGDAVLGEGSVFISADLAAYLDGLRGLRGRGLDVLCPGHGPPVWDPAATLDGYLAHRLDRERQVLDALASGASEEAELLDAVWGDTPAALRPVAAITLRAHLEKLRAEGRLLGR